MGDLTEKTSQSGSADRKNHRCSWCHGKFIRRRPLEKISAILEDLTHLKVGNYMGYDTEGEVFGYPDQVEKIDGVIKNPEVWLIEIKSSMSKADMYIFDRKVKFYEKKEGKKVSRKPVISPMIEPKAYEVAKRLGIEAYKAAEDLLPDKEI